ncbi:MAG: glycosyl hydrolase family 28-related protein [Pantoea sp.]|uniref:glycosyl hydrolase family 28-related protein n=1 Tax=Pantoea sp. TaxID=69393 RepID=UPI0039E6D080
MKKEYLYANTVNSARRTFLKVLIITSLELPIFFKNCIAKNSNEALINVLDFGAKGDGINDDSLAFQQACNHACRRGGGRVFIPNPIMEYKLLFPVYLMDNTELFGEGDNTRIVFMDPILKKGRGGFVIGSSLEANRDIALKNVENNIDATTFNSSFINPKQRQYLRDNPSFIKSRNCSIHDVYLIARFTSRENNWGGYGVNFVNAINCHVFNIWGDGWTQLVGMGSDVPPETPSNHNCSARNLHVVQPDLVSTYYSIGFIANSTNCVIENATQDIPMTEDSRNGSGVATNLCEDCQIKNIKIPNLGRTQTSEGVLINNSSGCLVENVSVGGAKTAVSVFYSLKETLNKGKPNIFNNITGNECDVVFAVYSKYNIIRNVTGINSNKIIMLKNNNATDNIFYIDKNLVSLANNASEDVLNKRNVFLNHSDY